MQNQPPAAAYLTRNRILKLLSDEEVARVSTAETAPRLSPGDQYVDLEHVEQGVRIATLANYVSTASLLPRAAVADATWRKILAELAGPRGERTNDDAYTVATFDSHTSAEAAILALHRAGVDMTRLSIVGRDLRTDEHPLGFYNVGDRMAFWGGRGAFWGSLWGMLFGSALFFVPTIGPVVVMGPLVAGLVGALEGAAVGGTLGVIGAALTGVGMPAEAVVKYEQEVRAGKFLVVAHGDTAMIERCRTVLGVSGASHAEASAE